MKGDVVVQTGINRACTKSQRNFPEAHDPDVSGKGKAQQRNCRHCGTDSSNLGGAKLIEQSAAEHA